MADRDSKDSVDEAEDQRNVGLMMRVKEGDQRAFQELVELHQYAVVGTVAKMLGNGVEAEDIAQQVFIRLWKSASRYEVKAKFTTFLFTIMRNLVFDEVRRKKHRKEHSLEEQGENRFSQVPDQRVSSPDNTLLKVELHAQIDKAIESLPEKQRMAVVLRRYENMPYEQIGEILELSVSAVKSQLFRARTKLRERLGEYLNDG